MKVLFLDWSCFGKDDTVQAIKNLDHEVFMFSHKAYNEEMSQAFVETCLSFVEEKQIDVCFSYNYYPSLAQTAKEADVPYISVIYDSPYVMLYSFTLMYPTNHVFIFDSSWVEELRAGGLQNVYYTVLPGNANKIQHMLKKTYDKNRLRADVSFVGALYNEAHNLYERLIEKSPEYLVGYLEGIIEAQQKIYGYSLVEDLLTEPIMEMMRNALDAKPGATYAEPPKYRYANYFIKRQITQRERMRLLSLVGESFGSGYDVKLFTLDPSVSLPGIQNMGVAKYENEMPYVFHDSKINLNISLRSIHTGIPLRCIDIMSSGGFLLSNYQSDFFADFIPGEDFDYFESPEDMLQKIDYYLTHDKQRQEIAKNGQEKVKNYFGFEAVLTRVFETVYKEIKDA